MTEYPFDTIPALLARGEAEAPAVGAPDRTALAYAGLRDLAQRTVAALNGMGIGRGDRVAIVLPNGPEMATAFVAIACGATTAPLNPGYRSEEFEFYLGDLGAKALIVLRGAESEARAAAAARGVPVIELAPEPDGAAGLFTLHPAQALKGQTARPGMAEADDVALVLHTSGTTSRPKIVPLSHINVTASAEHIGRTLALGREDVCLNIMPLFHIHGLIAAVAVQPGRRRLGGVQPGLQRLPLLRLVRRRPPDLVHGGAHHASGHPGSARRATGRRSRRAGCG